jgi:chemotaxis-related protein WspB
MLLLMFHAGVNRHAIDAARVVEVIPRIRLRSVSRATPELAGLFSYRGEVVPVVDLGVLLENSPCPDRLSTRIILVRADSPIVGEAPARSLLGLIAANVSDLIKVAPTDLTPDRVASARAPFLGPIIRLDDGLVQLVMVEHIWDKTIDRAAENVADSVEV